MRKALPNKKNIDAMKNYVIVLLLSSSMLDVDAQLNVPSDQIRFSENRGFDYEPVEDAIYYNGFNNGRVVKLGDAIGNGWFLGKIGIGITDPGGKWLYVKANSNGDHSAVIENISGSGYGLILKAANDPLRVLPYASNTNYLFVVGGNGNVGVGVTNAADKLHVNAAGGGIVRLSNDESSYLTSQAVTTGNIRNIAQQWNSNYSTINTNETSAIKFGYRADGNGQVRDAAIRFFTQDDGSGVTQERMSIVAGNLNIGTSAVNMGSEGGSSVGYGTRLEMMGADVNGDRLWLARYNTAANQTQLRVNIGDDFGQKEDMFVVGTHHWSDGAWNPHLAVQASGSVGIGTTDTHGFRLAVAGKAIAEEIVVQLKGNWPDYVFDEQYKLPSLQEVEQFIKAHRHLPDVPSAGEIRQDGLNLGEMNAILLKKLEELTLYVIELKHENDNADAAISAMQSEIDLLKKKVNGEH